MNRSLKLVAALAAVLPCLMTSAVLPGTAQETQPQRWPEMKCSRYKTAWTDALARMGTKGIGQEFLERHEAFLSSGCTTQGDVCPRSEEELKLANMLVIAAMNAGTASTFPPFGCRKPPSE